MTNLQEYLNAERECISKLESLDKTSFQTKREYIEKLIDIERVLIREKYYPEITIDKLANLINTKLKSNNIVYPRNESYYSLFSDEEKRSGGYGTNSNLPDIDSHEHDFKIIHPDLKECNCGTIIFKGLEYDIAPLKEESDKEIAENLIRAEKADPTKHPATHYLFLVQINALLLAKLSKELWGKWFDRKDPKKKSDKADIIDSSIKKVDDLVAEQKELQADLRYILKISDERQKLSPFQKLKASLLIDTVYNVSHVAKMLGITDKHASNTITKKREELRKPYLEDDWFNQIHLKCHETSCGNINTYSISEWIHKSLIRKDLGLTLAQPFN